MLNYYKLNKFSKLYSGFSINTISLGRAFKNIYFDIDKKKQLIFKIILNYILSKEIIIFIFQLVKIITKEDEIDSQNARINVLENKVYVQDREQVNDLLKRGFVCLGAIGSPCSLLKLLL